jgi:hypothetical protein
MHLQVFLKLKKPLKTLSLVGKYIKNPKNQKKTKNHWLGFFYIKKPGFFQPWAQAVYGIRFITLLSALQNPAQYTRQNVLGLLTAYFPRPGTAGWPAAWQRYVKASVLDPPDPHVFGPSGSISQRYGSGSGSCSGSGSGSFYH